MGGRGASSGGGGGGGGMKSPAEQSALVNSIVKGSGGKINAMHLFTLQHDLSQGMSVKDAIAKSPGITAQHARELISSGWVPNRGPRATSVKFGGPDYRATDQQLH
jgi:hypothetical protein